MSDTSVHGCNVVVLCGTLSRPPVVRRLPSGDSMVSYEVTSRPDGGAAITTPVSSTSPSAPTDLEVGAIVVVTGVVSRRFFQAGGVTQSRTEVVADSVIAGRATARARRAVERTLERAGLCR